jgi:TolB-like protein/cytochrome c-type biogenesis protein CcmH/NrfG/class 3 adenylate cyclase
MSSNSSSELKFDIGHVLFIDIVAYSKLLLAEQSNQMQTLREIVRGTEQFKKAEAEGKLLRLPTGDGGALVFRNSLEAPVLCALEISKALKSHPELKVRMGIHSGPVNEITDLNEQANIAGVGINMAQRVMDCGDAGHILLSKRVADDLEQYPQWRSHLSDLGECEVKHGTRVSVVNLYTDDAGNRAAPQKFSKQSAAVTPTDSVSRRDSRFPLIAGAALVLAIVIAVGWWASRPHKNVEGGAPATPNSQGIAEARPSIPEKSIAVLPFENLSDDKSNAYFAEGIQDEILTRLSKIAALKVISRTSSQKYKSAPENLREVGQQLGVANLLEGSVQKAGNAVHINVQLIKAATDEHLWAESYDRELQNIFGVEGEVAGKIADALDAKLSGAEEKAIAVRPTSNVAAYDAYLRALSIEQTQWSYAGWEKAATAYTEAVQLDPTFAQAWARLAGVRSLLYLNGSNITKNTAASVKQPADRAMALQPELGESWLAQGDYRYRVLRDFTGGLQAYDEARKRLPNSSLVFMGMASVERRLGRWQEAVDHYQKATKIDPRNIQVFEALAYNLPLLRRFDEARTALDHALEISPNDEDVLARKASILQREGRLDEAGRELAKIPATSTNEVVANVRIEQAIYERRYDDGIALIREVLNRTKPGEPLDTTAKVFLIQLANLEQWAGRSNEAQKAFSEALQAIKPTPETIVAADGVGMPFYLPEVYAGLGNKEEALAQAHRAVTQYSDDAARRPDAEATLAQIEARFGDLDSALAALPDLLKVPAGITAAELRLDPRWDPLRNDPRFQALLAKYPTGEKESAK